MADNKPTADEVAKQDAEKAAALADEKAAALAAMNEQDRQREMARAVLDAEKTTAQHEAVEGGRYKVGDQFVDANGEPIKGKKDD